MKIIPLLSIALLSALASAQAPAQPEVGKQVVGAKAGTLRYNVTFDRRSFTLDGFREAIQAGRTHEQVSEIVADCQAKARTDYAAFREKVAELGGSTVIEFWLINAVTIDIAPEHVETLEKLPNVMHVRPDLVTEPTGFVPVRTATNSNNHNADAVQAAGYKGSGYSFAIVDTGQDSNMAGTGRPHVQYYRNAVSTNTTGGGLNGSLLLANVQIPGTVGADDTHGHGTGVASISGATGWNSGSGDRGHAYDATRVGYSICVSAGTCSSSFAVEALGWQAAAADRVKYNIVSGNMSYGSSPSPIDVSQQAIDSACLNADLLAVCSAGNSSASTTGSPSVANGLAVAAVNPTTKTMATFSSRGPISGDTARFYPDIAACGVNTVMALRDNEAGNYTASGTSMASPQVCGAAALIKSVRPASNARELKAMLLANTEDISAQNPTAPYNSRNAYGMGFLRDDLTANAALVPGSVLSSTITSTTTPKDHLLKVTAAQRVSVALTWHRTNLAVTTWSNLDLQVYDGATLLGSSLTTRNLYEKVVFTAPSTGVVTVRVVGTSLDAASVTYSLASNNGFAGGQPSSYTVYGEACAGSAGMPGLSVSANPIVNQSFAAKLAFAKPSTPAFLLIGGSNTSWLSLTLPFNLGALAPSCTVLASGEVVSSTNTSAAGQASITLAVPNSLALLGLSFYNQYIVLDAVNPLGLVLSQGGKGTIGNF